MSQITPLQAFNATNLFSFLEWVAVQPHLVEFFENTKHAGEKEQLVHIIVQQIVERCQQQDSPTAELNLHRPHPDVLRAYHALISEGYILEMDRKLEITFKLVLKLLQHFANQSTPLSSLLPQPNNQPSLPH